LKNVLQMAVPIAAGTFFQTLFFFSLTCISGSTALAGVGAAGNIMFAVLALTQVPRSRHAYFDLPCRRPQGSAVCHASVAAAGVAQLLPGAQSVQAANPFGAAA
jgi:hypothetical protein